MIPEVSREDRDGRILPVSGVIQSEFSLRQLMCLKCSQGCPISVGKP